MVKTRSWLRQTKVMKLVFAASQFSIQLKRVVGQIHVDSESGYNVFQAYWSSAK